MDNIKEWTNLTNYSIINRRDKDREVGKPRYVHILPKKKTKNTPPVIDYSIHVDPYASISPTIQPQSMHTDNLILSNEPLSG